eukprot:COSAG03_NODE_15938_length_416_cov_0.804416_1_plen_78_part_01
MANRILQLEQKILMVKLTDENEQERLLRKTERQLNTCKVCFVGDGCVGKTSLLTVLRGLKFDDEQQSTCGMQTCTVDV